MLFRSCLVVLLFSPLIFGDSALTRTYNTQIYNEFLASNVYLTFAHRLSHQGIYQGFADFFYESAEEEHDHGQHLIDYYNLRNFDSSLSLLQIKVNDTFAKMSKLPEMIRTATVLEQTVLKSLNNVRQRAHDNNDYATVHFIEKNMLEEQITAVKTMVDLRERLTQSGESALFLQMMDQDLRRKRMKKQ